MNTGHRAPATAKTPRRRTCGSTSPAAQPHEDQPHPEEVREVETKLRVHGLFRLPIWPPRRGRPGLAAAHPVAAGGLSRHRRPRAVPLGVTLRRREGGDDAGWHMAPVEGASEGVRDELQVSLSEGEVGQVPAALRDVVTAYVRGRRLVPVVELRTERAPYVLYDADGVAFAELVDDRVSIYDGDDVVSMFREIEVEALRPDADLSGPVDLLLAAGAEPSEMSKARRPSVRPRRNRRMCRSRPRWVPTTPPVPPSPPTCVPTRAFLNQDVRVRRDLPDAVHQMRVAARRLRSGLKTFGELVDPGGRANCARSSKWAAGELGNARDTEVLLERLDEHSDDLGDREAALIRGVMDPVLRARLAGAREHALAAMRSERHERLLELLVDAAVSPQLLDTAEAPAEVLPPLVEKAWRKLRKSVSQLELEGVSETWHQARIAAKRARYAAGAVIPVFGEPAEVLEESLSDVTDDAGRTPGRVRGAGRDSGDRRAAGRRWRHRVRPGAAARARVRRRDSLPARIRPTVARRQAREQAGSAGLTDGPYPSRRCGAHAPCPWRSAIVPRPSAPSERLVAAQRGKADGGELMPETAAARRWRRPASTCCWAPR